MTISYSSIEDSLRNAVLQAGTNTEVIFHYPNAPRPAFPYTSLQPLSMQEEINDWTEFDKNDDISRWFGYRETTFTVNCFGNNAYDEAMVLQGKLRTQEVRETLRENIAASILSFTAPTILTALVDDEFERRTTFDVIMLINTEDGSTTDDTGYFDQVDDIEWVNRPPEN